MTKNWIHSGNLQQEPSEREIRHRALAGKAAAEGIVLLKNDGVLPLKLSDPIALFGSGADKTVKGGIGSGDVNNRENISIFRGVREAGAAVTSLEWLKDYDRRYDDAREKWKEKILEDAHHVDNPFDAYAANPFVLPEGRSITEKDLKGACAALYVISRISGEGKDRRLVEGDYYLSRREREDILYLDQQGLPLILILNAGGPVELTDILREADNIRAVLNISQPGQEGGTAVADILFGKAVPEGKLTATWAERYEDYPCADSFSYLNGNLEKEEYREGIYVGYRYFDSFGVKPLFPFGHGLSYTSFEMKFHEIKAKENALGAEVTVTNTGKSYAGREVIQVYVSLPQMGTEKEYRRLAGFRKTDRLKPGESQNVVVEIRQKQLAVFSEERQAWIVEKGMYGIWIGGSSAEARLCAFVKVPEEVILEETHRICPRKEMFAELCIDGSEKDIRRPPAEKERQLSVYEFIPRREKQKKYEAPAERRYPVEALIPLLYGNITSGASTLGSAGIRVPGSAGESTEALEEKYGIRSLIMADGPAGIRLRQSYQVDRASDTVYGTGVLGSLENGFLEPMELHENADTYFQYCTAFPVGTALAQTWDAELLREFGCAVAEEMEEYHVDLWLAPGMNIQRNPLCGRNFEYFSEDPLLTGVLAAAVTQGVQSRPGCGVTIKHFACNNQEDNRMGVDACISERALREIYLRGFEIAVKESAPAAVMSSYNLLNGVHAANSRDLCTVLAREEWGFQGVIMSDWNTTVPADGSIPWKCAAAGNDIIMPGNIRDDENIRQAYMRGELTEETIRECAGRIIALVDKICEEA
ncbi:MAG TPA: glycoside hydrolase family 3 C-terminal domain-containing protein [Candidatus Mediterraneibacter faecigallinarum]|uniref:Glycoside hydrolase family 3 C-terminal domain-containing protein n=1 Tax=Candidatus Mediterraneibacter faecigallinarum TaxID=2838669 RepID=A0A9D2SYI3_9FIRM|nr:glycoside hydrolase family 3 C-terminal domain-containing protein [Candidatus Mediterraneibacter faecigallinarum]